MVVEVTKGIKISVQHQYREDYSRPESKHYFFSYLITIENISDYSVKLLRRHWYIYDSAGFHSEVEGEGVVGEQPEIQPGETYQYSSGCNLTTEIGSMQGTYLMQRMVDKQTFEVIIPNFQLIVPYRLN